MHSYISIIVNANIYLHLNALKLNFGIFSRSICKSTFIVCFTFIVAFECKQKLFRMEEKMCYVSACIVYLGKLVP